MKKITLIIVNVLLTFGLFAQNSLVEKVPFTNIGPTVMSGRIVDFDVNPNNPTEFYAAYATGGLWYTNNNGTSFVSLLDNAPTVNIGDIAVDWNSDTIWVGTGENNSSRSSYSGIGMLKSTDKGKTWTNVGLTDSHHIGRIIINKNNPNEVIVGVIGHLYSPNAERGIFKTTDGGKTWNHVLFIDENTGVIDIAVSPDNPSVLYAASWERERKAWNFKGDGAGSAIYKSTDAGSTWAKLATEGAGFPTGPGVGRIGLAAFNNDVVYALLDNQNLRPEEKKDEKKGLKKDDFKTISNQDFLNLDNKLLNDFLTDNNFDKKYSAKSVKNSVKKGTVKPSDLALYLEDANELLLNSEVIGAEVYKTTDGGKTWQKTHTNFLDGVYSSYGYYFGIIAVNTANENKIYIGGVPLLKSDDGGKTFSRIDKENVHADHHALWINPKLSGNLINGNDGGINITYDDGENWIKNNATPVGQFYYINTDNQKPYNVFGGLQDNGVWYGPSNYTYSKRWNNTGNYPYKSIGGGDGMQVQIDSIDNNVVYAGSQFGYYYRLNLKTGERLNIHPMHELGDSPYRYNWQAPILLSPHNQDILYMGANKLLRSLNKGETFEVISGDLTSGGKKGNVPFGTLTTISESPFQFGLIYVGSDDGFIHLTTSGGGSWTKISNNLPQDLWVSRVVASQHEKQRVYATLNGYRNDDFKPYIFVSEDMGKTWKNISSNLPNYPVNVIKEDPADASILYAGTDFAAYVSFDNGSNWHIFSEGIPRVAVHDLVVQEQAKDLLIGTHGRSIFKTSIAELQQFNTAKNNVLTLFELQKLRYSNRWGTAWSQWSNVIEPKITLSYFAKEAGNVKIEILAANGAILETLETTAVAGFNYFNYGVSISEKSVKSYFNKKKIDIKKATNNKFYLPKGEYFVQISNAQGNDKQKLVIQ